MLNDNKNDLIRFVIENCTRTLEYEIVEFSDIEYNLCSKWSLIKSYNNEYEAIVFISSKYNHLNDYFIKSKLSKSFNSIPIDNLKLLKIVLDDYCNYDEENIKDDIIYINFTNKKIIYSDEVDSNILTIVSYYINNTRENKDKNTTNNIKQNKITYGIIVCNVVMYIITAILSGNIMDSNINVLVFLGAKENNLIGIGQYYRLITCMFLHGGLTHLALNMYALYTIGPVIEKLYGKGKYILIYMGSGICSSLLSYIFSPHVSIGASGAIFGLLGSCLIIAIKYKKQVAREFISNIISVILVNLIIGFSMANIDNVGHLGGLIGGIIISSIVWKNKSRN